LFNQQIKPKNLSVLSKEYLTPLQTQSWLKRSYLTHLFHISWRQHNLYHNSGQIFDRTGFAFSAAQANVCQIELNVLFVFRLPSADISATKIVFLALQSVGIYTHNLVSLLIRQAFSNIMMQKNTDYDHEKSPINEVRKRRDLYFACALIILWLLVFLAVHFGIIKNDWDRYTLKI